MDTVCRFVEGLRRLRSGVPRSQDPLARRSGSRWLLIALPKLGSGPSRLFELDKYANEKDYFLEEFSENAISMAEMYGNKMPDIRTAVRDAISYLDGKKEKRGEFLRKE